MKKPILYSLLTVLFFLSSCASFKSTKVARQTDTFTTKDGDVNIFLVGDAGKPEEGGKMPSALVALKEKFALADKNDVLLFLGDNVYQKGIPAKDNPERATADLAMQLQIDIAESFPGQVTFIPGNHDWYSGLKGLKRQEKMVEDALGKDAYLPNNGCPLDLIEVNDDLAIITVDSHWYVADWNNHPNINDNCGEINSRDKFWVEFGGLVNKQQNKTLIVAIHHPLFTNGEHDSNFKARPGFPIDFLRSTSGLVNADLPHPRYRQMAKRISTILSNYDNSIVVSGHEHNLQYLVRGAVKQIVSGSGSKETPLRIKDGDWGFAGKGFAILQLSDDKQEVTFFDKTGEQLEKITVRELENRNSPDYSNDFAETETASIYSKELFDRLPKGGFLTGERYRKYYGMDYEFPVANLETLYGGLTPIKMGGGFQSVSIRLEDKDGKEYAMRRLRKSATQFIQKEMFPENYIQDELDGGLPEAFIFDFYTTAYPFAFLTIGDLADAVGVYHTNPKVYYVPKQDALGKFNADVGDDLYLIEERPAKEWKHLESFGTPDGIESTDDVLQDILGDEDNSIDTDHFVRTRLFDMWLSDWDRHSDQFRWAVYEDGNKQVYRAIPRDRDQAFPKYDGGILRAGTSIVPALRKMQTIGDDLKSVKYLNVGNYKFDLALIQATSKEDWMKQAEYLAENLTDDVIEKAFLNLPNKAQDDVAQSIQTKLKKRRKHIKRWASDYYEMLTARAVITATNKDDFIDIHRNENKEVEVKIWRNKGGERKEKYVDMVYSPDVTKQIWIYGLNEKDEFTVTGGKSPIKVYLVGGANNDTYNIEKKSNIRVYDYASKENTFNGNVPKKNISDDYEANNFDVFKFQHNTWTTLPLITFDPDGGLQVGFNSAHNIQKFSRHGFSTTHQFGAKYYGATNGVAANYDARFRDAFKKFTFGIDADYSTPSYAENFFGYGEGFDFDDEIDFEYYRVRQSKIALAPSLIREWPLFGSVSFAFPVERIDVDDNQGRLVNQYFESNPAYANQLEDNWYYGLEASLTFSNSDNASNPSLGMDFTLDVGAKFNADNSNYNFTYVKPELGFQYPLIRSKNLVIATKAHGEFQFTDDVVPFYYGAAIGGNEGLRGFRNQRFTGDSGFYQNTDLRLNVAKVSTFLLPGTLGLFGGYDYGKVWMNDGDNPNLPVNGLNSDWQDSFGGGIYLNSANMFTIKTSYFSSDDGGRFVAGLGFDF